MRAELQPISSVAHEEDIFGVVEAIALLTGECYVDDMRWDEDSLLESFLETLEDPEMRLDYEAEPAAGLQLAKDQVIAQLREKIEQRHTELGSHSPFEWDFGRELLLRRKRRVSPVGIAYGWLSIFTLLQSDNDYLAFDPDPKGFLSAFDKVFEAVACYAVAGRRPSALWYLGEVKSARTLLERLTALTEFCGSGQVKAWNQLTSYEKRANDGGVDVIAVSSQTGVVDPDSEIYLVGATIQQTARRNKAVGQSSITRIRRYLLQQINLPFMGVMAVPFPFSELDAAICGDANCVYIPREYVLRSLANQPLNWTYKKYLASPSSSIIKHTRSLMEVIDLAA